MKKLIILFLVHSTFSAVHAQPHFRFIETDLSHSLTIESATLYGDPLADGSEIGVFTSGNICAGAVVWQGERVELSAWRDDPRTEDVEGFQNDEALAFRFWDIDSDEEFTAEADFRQGGELFRARGHSRLDLISDQNRPPELSGIGDQQVIEGFELSFELSATDPDEDELTYHVDGLPLGASLTNSTFSWTPSFYQAGDHVVTFIVSDGELTDSETITINVSNANGPPELAEVGDRQTAEDIELSLDLAASDPDEDELAFSAEDIPQGATLEGSHFSWIPSFDQSGEYPVTFIVTDNSEERLTDHETILITVVNTNRPPEISPIDNQQTEEGNEVSFELSASDPDNDELLFSADNLPVGAVLEGSRFSWTPSFDQEGNHEVVFIVSDGNLTDETTALIIVNNLNRTPEWILVPRNETVVGYVGESLQVEFAAADPDGENIEYNFEYQNAPESTPQAEIEIIDGRARFSMYPTRFEYGVYEVMFTAGDGEFSIGTSAVFEVKVDHFRFQETGRIHTIQIDEIDVVFGDGDNMPDPLDEIGVLTPAGMVAGSYRFTEEDEAPLYFSAFGDMLNVQGIEGFRNNDEFTFLYWDHSTGVEYDVSANLAAGDRTWRLEGFSVFNFLVGPRLISNIPNIEFGYLRTGVQLERVVQITSTGSTPANGVTVDVSGEGFSASPTGPFDLAIGESIEITVTFTPEPQGDYSSNLRIANDFASTQIGLTGTGIAQNHFGYSITNFKKTIRIIQADIDGEALSAGDEIGLQTPEDQLAGGAIFQDEEVWDIYAWGDDPNTREIDGFREGETIRFYFWDAEADRELSAFASYFVGDELWTVDSFSAVSLTNRPGHFHPSATNIRHQIVVNSIDYFDNQLSDGDEVAAITDRNIAAGAVTVDGDGPWEFEAFGDDLETRAVVEGFTEGTLLYFRIWDHNQAREVFSRVSVVEGTERFEAGGRTVVELSATSNDNAPVWRQVQNQRINEGEQIEFEVVAVDQDNNPLSLNVVGIDMLPGANFTDNANGTGQFSWTPNHRQAGDHSVRFAAFDGWSRSYLDVRITVTDSNQPPELSPIGDRSVEENEQLSILLEARDPDGDRLTYRAQNLPFGASLIENLFRWTPDFNQAGEYANVRFEAIDMGRPAMSDYEVIAITVRNVNRRPEWDPVAPLIRNEGQRITLNLTASDADDDNLSLSAENLPGDASFTDRGSGRGTFDWQTDFVSAGEYSPWFVVSDGDLGDTIQLPIAIFNVNRQPVLAPIGNVEVTVGQELDLRLSGSDPDPGEEAQLRFSAENLPPNAIIENLGQGEARLTWRPTYREAGSYPNVSIILQGPSGGRDYEQIRMTAILEDNDPPVIANISPANGTVTRTNQPTISAIITDGLSFVSGIEFTVDNRRVQDFSFDDQSGEFNWTPGQSMEEGAHSFRIRAIDNANNRSDAIVRFIVNSTAGAIAMDDTPVYTSRNRIHLNGIGEPFLSVQLFRNDELAGESRANGRGIFRFTLVQLSEEWNQFRVEGQDADGNNASPAEFAVYLDIVAPIVEINSPEELIDDPTPEIVVFVNDGEGAGVDGENRINLSIDNHRIRDYNYQQGVLFYEVQENLEEGVHFLAVSVVDILGNVSRTAITRTFFVDSHSPVITENNQNLIDDVIDTLANRQPVLTIPIADPEPGSGINWDAVSATLDGAELSLIIDQGAGSIGHDFREDDPLEEGLHELSISIPDYAGNVLAASGQFFIGDVIDEEGPFFVNPDPQGIIGAGLRPERFHRNPQDLEQIDTLSLVIGDNDAGVNINSIRLWLNGNEFGGGGMRRIGGDRIEAPLWYARNEVGRRRMPVEMPGLEEGFNLANAFGEDNEGNGNEQEWDFYYDAQQPGIPTLDEFERPFVNTTEITVTGVLGGDQAYQDGYQNQARVRIYCNGELAGEAEGVFEEGFSVSGIALVSGRNVIEATTVDAGDNESEFSDAIEIFLDLQNPEIIDFGTEGGYYIADGTPTLSATLTDNLSGIDPGAMTMTIDSVAIDISYSAEDSLVSGTVQDTLEDGDHDAILIIHDRAGNETTEGCSFNIDTRALQPPEFTLQPYTSEHQVVITGVGVRGQYARVYLNEELIELISHPDSDTFALVSTRDELPDTSYITMSASNEAGTLSELSDPQRLIDDSQSPIFSSFSPNNGSSVGANRLQEVSFTVTDTLTGIDLESFQLSMRGEPLQYTTEEIDFGYRISADVSGYNFGDNERIEMSSTAYDHSIPPNCQIRSWEFITTFDHPPEINFPDTTFAEDSEIQVYLFDFINDSDNGGANPTIAFELLQGSDNAEISLDEYGFLTITPAENFFGELSLRLHAQDATGLEDSDTSIVIVTPVNDNPTIMPIENTIAVIGQQFRLQVEVSDVDPGDTITFSDDFDFFAITPDGLIEFTPAEQTRGLYTVTVFATDQAEGRDSASFQLLITWENSEIDLVGDIADIEIDEDAAPIELTDLDEVFSDPDGQELRYSVEYTDNGVGLRIEIDADSHVPLLTLHPDYFGEVGVTITADDYSGSQVSITFTTTVFPVNDAPRMTGLLPERLSIDEDCEQFTIANLDTVFYDIEDDAISYSVEGPNELGIQISEDNRISIDPAEDWNGSGIITLTANDRGDQLRSPRLVEDGNEDILTLRASYSNRSNDNLPVRDDILTTEIAVVVRPINDAPRILIENPYEIEMEEDQAPLTIPIPLGEIFADVDEGDQISVNWEDQNGPVSLSFDDDHTHIMVMLTQDNWFGDEYDYPITAWDQSNEETSLTLRFRVSPVNDPPTVIQPLGDLTRLEDSGPWVIADLDDVFSDVDHDRLTFDVGLPDPLQGTIDDQTNVLTISAPPNYNADNIVIVVTAEDNQDGQFAVPHRVRRETAIVGRDAGPVRRLRSTELISNEFDLTAASSVNPGLPQRDDAVEDEFRLSITPVNDRPTWVNYPRDMIVVEGGDLIEFALEAEDIDEDQITLALTSEDLPDEAGFEEIGNGVGQFTWQTDAETFGRFNVLFSVSDGNLSSDLTTQVTINSPLQYFVGIEATESSHRIEVTGITFEQQAVPEGWEVGVFTPDDVLAGALRWRGERSSLLARGADEDHDGYFHAGDAISLRLWDNQADAEWPVRAIVAEGSMVWQPDALTVLEIEGQSAKTLEVPLRENWNLISINIIPTDQNMWAGDPGPEIIPMMAHLRREGGGEHHVRLMKDERGAFYSPARGYNGIAYWNLNQGYQVRMDSAMYAYWTGTPRNPQEDLPIASSWHMIAYLPDYPLPATRQSNFYVLSDILDQVVIAKDGFGNFMYPRRGYSGMPDWREGQGYQIKLDADVVLNYPQPQEQDAALTVEPEVSAKGPWDVVSPTGANMSLLLSRISGAGLFANDQVAAFNSSGILVGVGGVIDGMVGLAVWGDDASTTEIEGLRDNEAFTLKLWDSMHDEIVDLAVSSLLEGGGLIYEPDGFSVIEAKVQPAIPSEIYLGQGNPNPFNAVARIKFGLPEASRVTIRVFDVAGRELAVLVNGELQAGNHTAVWSAEGSSSGIYLVRMETPTFSATQKVTLMK